MADDIRERARQILSEVPPLGQQINSVGPTAGKFVKMTGTSQATLEANWKTGGIMTTCNAFVGWVGRELGSKNYLGRFDLETMVKKWGKEHAWIPATSAGMTGAPSVDDQFVAGISGLPSLSLICAAQDRLIAATTVSGIGT